MRILAIDPGNTMSAFCVIADGKPVHADKRANDSVVQLLRGRGTVLEHQAIAIEMIASYGMAVGKEVFDTCLWIGRFLECCEAHGAKTMLVYRRDVKQHLCHTARATDANVRAAILDRFGPGREIAIGTKKAPGPLYGIKGDEWSALAVALTAQHTLEIGTAPPLIPRSARSQINEGVGEGMPF